MSPETRDLRAFQAAFAARIRDPENQPRPHGVPAQRMQVYEDLLFNNLEGFLLACFPVTHQLLGEPSWRSMARRFFVEHRCESPLFRDIPGEFLDWMKAEAGRQFPDHPYLYEFMHYEWLELSVSVSADEVAESGVELNGDLLVGRPVLNPTARLACYQYPVHLIGPGFRLDEQKLPEGQVFWYLVYRDVEDAVRFIVLNPVSARLLDLIRDSEITGRQAMMQIAQELNHHDHKFILEMGQSLLEDLRRAGAVYGARRKE